MVRGRDLLLSAVGGAGAVLVFPLVLALMDRDVAGLSFSQPLWLYGSAFVAFFAGALLGRSLAPFGRAWAAAAGIVVAWMSVSWILFFHLRPHFGADGADSPWYMDLFGVAMVSLVLGAFAWLLLGIIIVRWQPSVAPPTAPDNSAAPDTGAP